MTTEEIKSIFYYLFLYYVTLVILLGFGYLIYSTSNKPNPNDKYRYVVTLDERWTHESNIYCDNFNNKTDTTIVVYIDGRTVNLKAREDIMIQHNYNYKLVMK